VQVPPEFIQGAAGAGDAFASGVLHGIHEGWPMAESLRLGVSVAAASLAHPTCSEGVVSIAECRALAYKFGYRHLSCD
jgi:sugar/nucleoside kinase (ribokinase family)